MTRNLPDLVHIFSVNMSLLPDHAPIKVDGSYNSNSGINERAFGKSNLC